MMNDEKGKHLLKGYLEENLSAEELQEFLSMLSQEETQPLIQDALDKTLAAKDWNNVADASRGQLLYNNIMQAAASQQQRGLIGRIRLMRKPYAAAAAVAVLLAAGWLIWRNQPSSTPQLATVPAAVSTIVPGGDKATLTLENGTVIVLDTAANGKLVQTGGVTVAKTAGGELVYSVNGSEEAGSAVRMHTLSTPRGGQFRIKLPDGSQAFLNAASSVRFPSVFAGNERRVTVSGEVYFEIAQAAVKPFIVSIETSGGTSKADIEVLGTDFNVMAYDNEEYMAATLLSGKIKVTRKSDIRSQLLNPGEQLRVSGRKSVIVEGMEEQAVAWKNGYFYFDKAGIKDVMRQLERWYNISVVYDQVPGKTFSGTIPRSSGVMQVLNMLEGTGNVSFEVNGNEVKVSS